jgi:hypothetical protein
MSRNNKQAFSLVSASRAGEKVDKSKRFEVSSIDSYRDLSIDYLDEDLMKHLDFPHIDERGVTDTYGPQFLNAVPRGYTLSKKLGAGSFGTTFSICKNKFECSALKVVQLQDGRQELNHEITMQNKFHAKQMAPAIIGKPTFYNYQGKEYGVINMEKIDGVLDHILSKDLTPEALDDIARGFLFLVSQLDVAGYAHRDAHPGNIAVNYKRDAFGKLTLQLSLIDFGHSKILGGSWPELEILQFLRTLSMKDANDDPGVTPANQMYLWDRLLAFYQANFDPRVQTEDEVDDLFNALFDESGQSGH